MVIALALAAGVEWAAWSPGTMDRARRDDRPVFVVVAGSEAPPLLSDDGVAEVLESRFTPVRVDRDERPDVADLARLSLSVVSEAAPPSPESPLWVIFTPSLHPLAAGSFPGISATELARGLGAIADAYRSNRTEMEAKAGIAAVHVAAAQASDGGGGPLGPTTIERALRSVGGEATRWGPLRLLQVEAEVAPSDASRQTLARVLARLAAAPEPQSLAGRALRLRALAKGLGTLGAASLAAATREAVASLLEMPRSDGAFVEDEPQRLGRVFAHANGLAAGALAVASQVEGDAAPGEAAARAMTATLERLGPWAELARCSDRDTRCGPAYLEDYAFLAEALLDLNDATGDGRWSAEAQRATEAAIARFLDAETGAFFDTDSAHEPLPTRLKDAYDGERPSANGVMVSVLVRLGRATGETRYAGLARRAIQAFSGDLEKAPRGLETLAASAVPLLTSPPRALPSPLPFGLARQTRGPVTVEASLDSDRVLPGAALAAHVRVTVEPPWTVNGHRPAGAGLVPLTISVPDPGFRVGTVLYPAETSSTGSVDVLLPLRVAPTLGPGARVVPIAVRFQACRGPRCSAPESVVLDTPLRVEGGVP
jgi:Protein of unknown function, DUF255